MNKWLFIYICSANNTIHQTAFPGGTVERISLPMQETQETQVRSLGQEDPLEEEIGQPIPVFLPGKFHKQRSLAGHSSWGRKESDMTEWLST